jgi:hypothetical protein
MNDRVLDADLNQQAKVLRELLFACVPPASTADSGRVVAFRRLLVDRVLHERHVGVGSLCDCFPLTLDAWRQAHPADAGLRQLAAGFLGSKAYETAGGFDREGVEEAFGRFAMAAHFAVAAVVKREMIRAVLAAVAAIAPAKPYFSLPHEIVRRDSGALVAVIYDDAGRAELLAMSVREGRPCFISGRLTASLARALVETGFVASPAVRSAVAAQGL